VTRMTNTHTSLPRALSLAIVALLASRAAHAQSIQAPNTPPINIAQTPLFVGTATKPNVLFTIANSQSMDEDATGLAVGATNPNSRSEIARRVTRNLIANYANAMNVGLMAFQQNAQALWNLHSSPYDVSYDPADYDPAYVGPRDGQTKKFREPNPSDAGRFIYFNVNLPYYNSSNDGNGFCYSRTANAFNNGENPVTGPWDSYRCFRVKTGTSNVVPNNNAQDAPNGWSSFFATCTCRSRRSTPRSPRASTRSSAPRSSPATGRRTRTSRCRTRA
jgi:type IV pilus assembly protein PilY1